MLDDRDEPGEAGSFFAELLAETHGPCTVAGVQVDPPDAEQVCDLDTAATALDELETLAGDQFDDLLDELDEHGISPAEAADTLVGHFHLDRPPDGGWAPLITQLDAYGEAIEYDWWDRGHHLSDYFTGARPWGHLLRILAQLPMGSRYRAAVADDDELAARVAEVHGPPSKRRRGAQRPPLSEWSREIAYLHLIDNRLQFLGWAVFAAQAGKKRGRPPRPSKGPETADDRFEQLDFLREHEEVVSQVLKRKGGSRRS